MDWERPSKRVRELIRRGATMIIDDPREWLAELNKSTLASQYLQAAIAGDPAIAEAIRRSNRSNHLHWAAANIAHPGEPVRSNYETERAIVRDLIRRGLNESSIVDAYRTAESAALRSWNQIALKLTADPHELSDLLDVCARSITLFIDTTIASIYHQIQTERDELSRETDPERRETIALILNGAPISQQHAENRLGYHLGQHHTAAVIWGEAPTINASDLDRATEALTNTENGCRPLSVPANAETRWIWLPGCAAPDLSGVVAATGQLPGVRVAVGPTAAGIEGFRSSHLDAITTQRTMIRLNPAQRVARFTDVELVALITADPERADRFIEHTLGAFASAGAELQKTVHTFVREQCNASQTIARLFVHRNTLRRRLAHADRLLPQTLRDNVVHVAVALEVLDWRGQWG